MSSEKKIKFTGEDAGASQAAKQIFNTVLSDAKKYTESLKEQNSYINKQIQALEKKAKIQAKEGQGVIKELEELYRSARTPEEKNKFVNQQLKVGAELRESSQTIELLKDIYEENKKLTTTAEKAEKDNKRKSLSSEEQFASMQSLARQEVRENKAGVRSKIKQAERSNYEDVDPYTAQKLMYQKSLVGEEKSKSIIGEVFTGTFLAGVVGQVIKQLSQITGAKSGEEGFNTLLGSIPFVGGLMSGAKSRSFDEQYSVQTKELGLYAKTGSMINGLNNQSGIGYSNRETLDITEGLVGAAGSARGASQTNNALLLQRGLGLSTDVITQIVKDLRTTRSSADIMQIASDVLQANPELRKDQTKFAEILAQTSQLTNTLAAQSENVDPRRSAGIVGALRSVGGSFADSNLGAARMNSINNSLTNPSTDYQKARSFGVLSKLNPGASWFKINEMMEGGIGQKGYLSGILKQFSRESGGGEEGLATQIQQNLGLGFSSSRLLSQKFLKDPKFADNFSGGLGDIEKDLGLTERAKRATSGRDKDRAEIDNAFLVGAVEGLTTVSKLVGSDIVDAIEKIAPALSKANESFAKSLGIKKEDTWADVFSRKNEVHNK